MKNFNICKFTTEENDGRLYVSCFILESDTDTMKKKRTLDMHRILLIKEGTGSFFADHNKLEFSKGDIVFLFKNESICANGNEECQYMYIDFGGSRAEELLKRFDINSNNRLFSGFDGLVPIWNESLSRANENTIDLAGESMLLYAFSRLNSKAVAKNDIVDTAIEITESLFSDSQLSLAVISDKLGYNSKYISHLFKQKMGIGYSEYLRSVRIKYAVALFDHGIDSVKNVALLSGFADPFYFSTVFKKQTGLSPKDYKKELLLSKDV